MVSAEGATPKRDSIKSFNALTNRSHGANVDGGFNLSYLKSPSSLKSFKTDFSKDRYFGMLVVSTTVAKAENPTKTKRKKKMGLIFTFVG